MTSGNILSAPVTEYAFIKLKEGKENQREEVERLIGELQQKISTAEGYHASSWGQSVDLGKENVYIFVLGWDTADVESFQREEISKD
jgi:heme-degrading monooxygenase HmoA